MKHLTRIAIVILCCYSGHLSRAEPRDAEDQRILATREAVWRAWFANDERTLRELVPAETIVISPSEEHWENQAAVFAEARKFHDEGGKLVDLQFAQTVVQRFGDVACVYSEFRLETIENGKRSATRGRATELFVLRNGKWLNPGWHTDRVSAQSH